MAQPKIAPDLERVEFTLLLPTPATPGCYGLSAHGRSQYRRAALWSYHEAFDAHLDAQKGYSVADALHHIALVCVQDTPNTLNRLDFALSGGLSYAQGELDVG